MKCTRTVSHLAPSNTAPALATTRIDCQYKQAIDARFSSSAGEANRCTSGNLYLVELIPGRYIAL